MMPFPSFFLRHKRGAGFLELFMTYGWAVIILAIILGTLIYFGLFKPTGLLPEKCVLRDNFKCSEQRLDMDNQRVNFRLENQRDIGVMITKVRVFDEEGLLMCEAGIEGEDAITSKALFMGTFGGNTGWHINALEWDDISIPCSKFEPSGEKKAYTLRMVFFLDDASPAFSHPVEGEMVAIPETIEI